MYADAKLNVTTNKEYIETKEGESVVLTCSYDTVTEDVFIIHWLKAHRSNDGTINIAKSNMIWTYQELGKNLAVTDIANDHYRSSVERANVNSPIEKSHSIRINEVTQQDEAVYVCELMLGSTGTETGTAETEVNVLSKFDAIQKCELIF